MLFSWNSIKIGIINSDNIKNSNFIILLFLFLCSLLIKLIYFFQTISLLDSIKIGDRVLGADNWLYIKIAYNIINGNLIGGSHSIYTSATPLYAYFLALCFKLFGSHLWVPRLIQLILGAFVPPLIFLLSRLFYSRNIAFLSAILAALFLPFTYYEGLICKFSLLPFISTCFLYFFCIACFKKTFLRWFFVGIMGVCFYLIRPNIIITYILLLFWFLFFYKKSTKPSFIGLVLGISLMMIPIGFRHYIALQKNLVSYLGGIHFYIGNNPQATGTFSSFDGFHPGFKNNLVKAQTIAEKQIGKELNRKQVSLYWYKEGLKWIIHNPLKFIKLFLKKILLSLSFFEIGEYGRFSFWTFSSILRFLIPAGFVSIIGSLGLIYFLFKKRRSNMLIIFCLGYLLGLALFLVTGRYRLPVFIPMLCFSGYIINEFYLVVIGFFKEKREILRFLGATVVVMLLFVFYSFSAVQGVVSYNSYHSYYYGYYSYYYLEGHLICSFEYLGYCTTQEDCEAAGGHWCDGICQAGACGAEAPPTGEPQVGMADPQTNAHMPLTDGQVNVNFNYSAPVYIFAGMFNCDFSQVKWLNCSGDTCAFGDKIPTTPVTTWQAEGVELPYEAGYVFWMVVNTGDLNNYNWRSNYILRFYLLGICR